AGEKSQLDDLALLRTEFRQLIQSVIQGQEIEVFSFVPHQALVKGQLKRIPAALGRFVIAGVIHEDLPHELGCDSKEMSTVFPLGGALSNQPHVRFVDKSSALEGVIASLLLQIVSRNTPKFLVNQR